MRRELITPVAGELYSRKWNCIVILLILITFPTRNFLAAVSGSELTLVEPTFF